MGLLEAICVIYLRRLILPEGIGSGTTTLRLGRHVELIREASTIVMLATVAGLAGRNARSRLATFFVMFGVWDILYYIGLWWLAGWPSSLLTWDCLFLIPKPWYGPVLAPVLISVMFIVGCGRVFLLEESGRRVMPTPSAWVLLTAGVSIWYWSFVKDTAAIKAHGYADMTYSWLLFACGAVCAGAGFLQSWLQTRKMRDRTTPPVLKTVNSFKEQRCLQNQVLQAQETGVRRQNSECQIRQVFRRKCLGLF